MQQLNYNQYRSTNSLLVVKRPTIYSTVRNNFSSLVLCYPALRKAFSLYYFTDTNQLPIFHPIHLINLPT